MGRGGDPRAPIPEVAPWGHRPEVGAERGTAAPGSAVPGPVHPPTAPWPRGPVCPPPQRPPAVHPTPSPAPELNFVIIMANENKCKKRSLSN